MDRRRRVGARASASSVALLLLAIVAFVLFNAMMIAGATNCASAAPDVRCAIAKFIAG